LNFGSNSWSGLVIVEYHKEPRSCRVSIAVKFSSLHLSPSGIIRNPNYYCRHILQQRT
jgi:hypothetical protein